MKKAPVVLGVLALAAAISSSVQAQQMQAADEEDSRSADKRAQDRKATELDRVIVTGVRAPKAVDKIPGAISIITPEEIKQSLIITEDNTAVLARTIPGYAESSQAMTNSGESLRGRIPLRLFDSIPQGSPLREGTRNGTFTDMGVIGRIEVINGPSAAEGIGATGGVINYISKVPEQIGSETTINARYQTQFNDDSVGWKLGLSHAIKQDNYDFLASVSQLERGMAYDAKNRSIGMNSSGSLADSQSRNLYMKGGYNFGEDGEQRLQATYSNFNIGGNGDYIQLVGCKGPNDWPPCDTPVPNTSIKGHIDGQRDALNKFIQYSLQYTHSNFYGGTLDLVGYQAKQGMRFLPENGADRQLVKPAPADDADRIFDQSEIQSRKKGLRTSWTRPSIFGVDGLELHTGVDFVQDVAEQRLVMTDRVWVPPMDYRSVAPYAQLSWDIGPVTVSGGFRRENGELDIDSYTTVAYRNNSFVEGGTLDYTANLPNIGAIWRVTDEFSLFSAYSKGFTLPDIGIPLRNVNYPGQTVAGILDLQAIIVDNIDIGFNWRGSRGALSGSWYHSTSDFGASLEVDPLTSDFIMTRAPTDIKGIELTGEFRFTDTFKITGLYTHLRGYTSFWGPDPQGRYDAGPMKKPLGIFDATPDKINVALVWKALPNLDATLGASMLRDRHLTGSAVREYDGEEYDYDEKINGYTLWDLGVNYDSGRFGTFSLGVDNLFNKYYILSGSQGDGWQNYWAGRGRVVSLSYSYTFR
ncbi:TonB-dependent receptor [Stenotrophomonas sp.]|uniref:TonB-dependent receptor n=1 Tax=Stenotrophomonas sp. TaxID=69392 RepID=UPI0028AB8476|nr:TonB-dependent receptor [Stenotrophomonas sp.]